MILHADGGPKGVVRSWDTNPNPGIVIKGESICVRGVEVTGGPMRTTSAISVYGSAAKAASEIVILDCWVHDNGTPGPWTDATPDEDHHGIGIGAYSNVVRVVGCRLDRNSGDGIQINAGTLALLGTIDDVIVEGCSADDNKQAGFWAKASQNVTFRGNTVRNSRGSASNPDGAGMGAQYGPINVRFVGNTIADCRTGFLVGSRSGPGGSGPGTGIVIEGNTISTATVGLRVLGDNVVAWRGNTLKDVATEMNANSAATVNP